MKDSSGLNGAGDVEKSVQELLNVASTNGIPDEHAEKLCETVTEHTDMFPTTYSADPPASFLPLTIKLSHDDQPVRVRFLNYSQEQR